MMWMTVSVLFVSTPYTPCRSNRACVKAPPTSIRRETSPLTSTYDRPRSAASPSSGTTSIRRAASTRLERRLRAARLPGSDPPLLAAVADLGVVLHVERYLRAGRRRREARARFRGIACSTAGRSHSGTGGTGARGTRRPGRGGRALPPLHGVVRAHAGLADRVAAREKPSGAPRARGRRGTRPTRRRRQAFAVVTHWVRATQKKIMARRAEHPLTLTVPRQTPIGWTPPPTRARVARLEGCLGSALGWGRERGEGGAPRHGTWRAGGPQVDSGRPWSRAPACPRHVRRLPEPAVRPLEGQPRHGGEPPRSTRRSSTRWPTRWRAWPPAVVHEAEKLSQYHEQRALLVLHRRRASAPGR